MAHVDFKGLIHCGMEREMVGKRVREKEEGKGQQLEYGPLTLVLQWYFLNVRCNCGEGVNDPQVYLGFCTT